MKFVNFWIFVCFGTCSGLCPDGWVYFRGSCYLFSHEGKSFTESEHFCSQHQAHLTKIETKEENLFLKSFCTELKDANHWIGLTDIDVEGIWKWTDNTDAEFKDWYPTQPNNQMVSNCCALWVPFQYAWADEPCSSKYSPICERPESSDVMVVG